MSEKSETKLADCPFCGGPVKLTTSKTLGDRLFCIQCEEGSPCIGSGLGIYVVAGQVDDAVRRGVARDLHRDFIVGGGTTAPGRQRVGVVAGSQIA